MSWDISEYMCWEYSPPQHCLYMLYLCTVVQSVLHESAGAGWERKGWIRLSRLTLSFTWVFFFNYLNTYCIFSSTTFVYSIYCEIDFAGKLSWKGKNRCRGWTCGPSEATLYWRGGGRGYPPQELRLQVVPHGHSASQVTRSPLRLCPQCELVKRVVSEILVLD